MVAEVVEALKVQNPWWETKEVPLELIGYKRDLDLKEFLKIREIKLITGVRRGGKSTLFYQLIKELISEGTDPTSVLFINFDFNKFKGYSLDKVFQDYLELTGVNPKEVYLFLDEVHHRDDWVPWVRRNYDLRTIKQIFITDSSSKLMEKEYSKLLSGRNVKIIVFSLSFTEYLRFADIQIDDIKLVSSRTEAKIKSVLRDYLKFGAFPEVFFKSEQFKYKVLKDYFDDIINKDIGERYKVDVKKVKTLAQYLLTNTSKIITERSIRNALGFGLETISDYVGYLQEVFLVSFVTPFSYSLKSQIKEMKKTYGIDTGLRNAISFRFSEDIGRLYENVVFIELKRRTAQDVLFDVYYWRDYQHREVDFVVKEGLNVKQLIQVCYDLNEDNKRREVNNLILALKSFQLKEGFVITNDYEGEEKIKGKKIKFIPLWKWLMTK